MTSTAISGAGAGAGAGASSGAGAGSGSGARTAGAARAPGGESSPTTGGRPLRRDAELNRLRVLVAAREVFAEHGLVATLDEVARHAGVGVGTVYRRFPDKESLVDALFEQSIDNVAELAESCLADADSWAGLARFVENSCAMNAKDRGLKAVLLGASYGQSRVARAKDRLAPLARKLVERAQADGHLRPDVSATDIPLLNVVLGAVVDYTGECRPDAWRRFLTIMLDGLRADGSANSPMPVPPLTEDDLTGAMSCWPRRRH